MSKNLKKADFGRLFGNKLNISADIEPTLSESTYINRTYQINLVSWNYFGIWAVYGQIKDIHAHKWILDIRILAITQLFFGQFWYIVYRLVTRNHDSLGYLQISFLMGLYCDSRKDARKLINQFFMSQHIGFNASGIQSALIYWILYVGLTILE